MTGIIKSIQDRFSSSQQIPAGTYHYISPQDDPRNYRLHLRIEDDGNGILIINASTILHMNQTAAEYAYYLVKNTAPEEAAKNVARRYRGISTEQALNDYQDLITKIQVLINTPDLDPVTFLDFERKQPFTGYISAPYRLDCALTYKLPKTADPEAAPIERVEKELSPDEWLHLIDKSQQAGIPHLVFTGGEPTLREDLLELLNRAEENNQVTGLLSEGLRFSDEEYLDSILQTGLDHLTMILHPENPDTWSALENVLREDLYVDTHLTLTTDNQPSATSLVDKLLIMGVSAISLTTNNPDLASDLESLREYIADADLELIWNLPVPYSSSNPVAFETAQFEEKEGAGRAWLYIEPDGDVLPSQGINQVLGNFLTDPWETIWMKAHSE